MKYLKMFRDSTLLEKLVGVAILSIVLGGGCSVYTKISSLSLKSGTVISRNYTAPWTHFDTTKIGDIQTVTPIYHPERYSVTIEGIDINGKFKRRTIDVPAQEYATIKTGDTYTP